jgi:hypothetical protein
LKILDPPRRPCSCLPRPSPRQTLILTITILFALMIVLFVCGIILFRALHANKLVSEHEFVLSFLQPSFIVVAAAIRSVWFIPSLCICPTIAWRFCFGELCENQMSYAWLLLWVATVRGQLLSILAICFVDRDNTRPLQVFTLVVSHVKTNGMGCWVICCGPESHFYTHSFVSRACSWLVRFEIWLIWRIC